MATRLAQIIAVEKGAKSKAHETITEAYQRLQKGALLSGISRTYRPKDDEGEQLPSESTRVQMTVDKAVSDVMAGLTRLFNVTATKDVANQQAVADVTIDGTTILKNMPATYLIFLEKQLVDIHTFVSKLPTLDPSEEWHYNEASATWATTPTETTRTKKVPRNHVLAEATDKHPAQVQVFTEDQVVGYWKTIKYSGALPQTRANELISRVERLQDAVKIAREQANTAQVTDVHAGEAILGYIFAK